jgi:transcriptional antiterminator
MAHPEEQLYEEIAFIAYHFHWSYRELMEMDHRERRRWCEEISKINRRLTEIAQKEA